MVSSSGESINSVWLVAAAVCTYLTAYRFYGAFIAAKVMALDGRQCPANLEAYKDPAVAKDPILAGFRDQVEVAIPMPNVPEMTMVWSPATTALNKINAGSTSPKEALDVAQKAVERDVAGLRKSR